MEEVAGVFDKIESQLHHEESMTGDLNVVSESLHHTDEFPCKSERIGAQGRDLGVGGKVQGILFFPQ